MLVLFKNIYTQWKYYNLISYIFYIRFFLKIHIFSLGAGIGAMLATLLYAIEQWRTYSYLLLLITLLLCISSERYKICFRRLVLRHDTRHVCWSCKLKFKSSSFFHLGQRLFFPSLLGHVFCRISPNCRSLCCVGL